MCEYVCVWGARRGAGKDGSQKWSVKTRLRPRLKLSEWKMNKKNKKRLNKKKS